MRRKPEVSEIILDEYLYQVKLLILPFSTYHSALLIFLLLNSIDLGSVLRY